MSERPEIGPEELGIYPAQIRCGVVLSTQNLARYVEDLEASWLAQRDELAQARDIIESLAAAGDSS